MAPIATSTDASASTKLSAVAATAKGAAQSTLNAATAQPLGSGLSSKEIIHLEHEHAAHNYHPLPCVFDRASGAHVWDPEGRQYLDFLSAYSAVNQGHCHPKIVGALVAQAQRLTLSSRAFYSSSFGPFAKKITEMMGYDMVLPMNTGVEAVETAIKLARKWGYTHKSIPPNQAIVLSAEGNFHGRSIAVISMSTDPDSRTGYGPFVPNLSPGVDSLRIRHGHAEDLEAVLEAHGKRVAAFLVEPIQGEAGIMVPPPGYLQKVRELCTKHKVLLICDEIQTGLGRTGKMLAVEHEGIRPDVITLGKALSGGIMPVSAVLADKEVMLCMEPGTHGSTFGANPLGCTVALAALEVLKDEKLCERAERLGAEFREEMTSFMKSGEAPHLVEIRGRGLMNAIVLDEAKSKKHRTAWQLCLLLKDRGVLCKPTHDNVVRLTPPLVISDEDMRRGTEIIKKALLDIDVVEVVPGEEEGAGH